jgi:hypothetical protein
MRINPVQTHRPTPNPFDRPAALDGARQLAVLEANIPDGGSTLYLGTDNELYVVNGSIAGPQYFKLEQGPETFDVPENLEQVAETFPPGADVGSWVMRDTETGELYAKWWTIAGEHYAKLDQVDA